MLFLRIFSFNILLFKSFSYTISLRYGNFDKNESFQYSVIVRYYNIIELENVYLHTFFQMIVLTKGEVMVLVKSEDCITLRQSNHHKIFLHAEGM